MNTESASFLSPPKGTRSNYNLSSNPRQLSFYWITVVIAIVDMFLLLFSRGPTILISSYEPVIMIKMMNEQNFYVHTFQCQKHTRL